MNHYEKQKPNLPDNFAGGCFKNTDRFLQAGHDIIPICELRDWEGKIIKDKYNCRHFKTCAGFEYFGRRT